MNLYYKSSQDNIHFKYIKVWQGNGFMSNTKL